MLLRFAFSLASLIADAIISTPTILVLLALLAMICPIVPVPQNKSRTTLLSIASLFSKA
jgi:hypothetical protein